MYVFARKNKTAKPVLFRRLMIAGLAVLVAGNIISGCVYYNLFYNIKRSTSTAK